MKIERILVALDTSFPSLTALETAVNLAERLDIELHGLFIEDINLLRLAQLPFARELRFPGATALAVDTPHMEAQLREQATLVRRRFRQMAESRHLRHSFRVVRGVVATTLLEATTGSDLLVLGRASYSLVRSPRLGSTAQTAVQQAECAVLLVHPQANLDRPPLLLYDGSPAADRALSVALSLVERNGRLYILLYLPDNDSAQQAIDKIQNWLDGRRLQATYRRLYNTPLPELINFINNSENSLLILSDHYPQFPPAVVHQLAEKLTCPVLVVR